MKTVYQTDENGHLVGPVLADPDPMEAGRFLIPGGCIEAAPPAVPEGKRARWTGAAWTLDDIPQPPAPPAPPAPPSAAEIRAGEIRGRLYQIDADSVRAMRVALIEQAGGRPIPQFERTKLDTLETEAADLRAELAAMGAA